MREVYTGKVVWFNTKKGFGYISRDDGKADIFFYWTDIMMEGYKALVSDDVVSFEEDLSYKNRLKACPVILLKKNENAPQRKPQQEYDDECYGNE
jgi:CspA family cold shock protein